MMAKIITIPLKLLNRSVTISKFTETRNLSSDVSNTPTPVSSGVRMRICSNRRYGSPGMEQTEYGIIAASTHEGFCLPGVDVKIGYTVTDELDGDVYNVNFVDDMPGGIKTHHQEVFMTKVER